MRTPSGNKVYGMAAEYPSAAALYEAAKRVRDAGFKRWDVHSPFPIHGMDDAMGLGKSWLSAPVLIGGITGFFTAITLTFGPSWFIYPLVVHGKPYDWRTVPAFFPIMFELTFGPSWFIYPLTVHGKPYDWRTVPAFFPIMFELTVLFAAFTCFFSMLIMNGLPRWHHPVFNWSRFSRVTNDAFFLVIEARDPRFTESEARQLLEETGGQHLTVIHED